MTSFKTAAVTDDARFAERADRSSGGCWMWRGAPSSSGYGRITLVTGRRVYVHRWVYERFHGPIPDGYQIDHLCVVPMCCNPDHLEAVLPIVNNFRSNSWAGRRHKVTHCPRGHELAGDNLKVDKLGHRRLSRVRQDAQAGRMDGLVIRPCPDAQTMHGFSIAGDGTVLLDCRPDAVLVP